MKISEILKVLPSSADCRIFLPDGKYNAFYDERIPKDFMGEAKTWDEDYDVESCSVAYDVVLKKKSK